MAITTLNSYLYSDLMTLKEAVELFRPTDHPVCKETLRRWLTDAGKTPAGRRGRDGDVYPMADLFEVHGKNTLVRDGY